MLKTIVAFLLMLFAQRIPGVGGTVPAGGGATPSYTGNTCAGTSFVQSCTITGVTAGDAIIFYTVTFGTNAPACADNVGTPTAIKIGTFYGPSNGQIAVCVLENAAAGSHLVSALCSGCTFGDFFAYEFTGVPTSSVTEGATIATTTVTAATASCASTTTTGANDIFFSVIGTNGFTSVAPTSGPGMTQLSTDNGQSSSAYSALTVAAGSYAPTWSFTGGNPTYTVAVCFGIK